MSFKSKRLRGLMAVSAAAAGTALLHSFAPPAARAGTLVWDNNGGSGGLKWNTATNWDLDVLPTSADTVTFSNTNSGIIGNIDVAGTSVAVDTLNFTNASGTYQITTTVGTPTLTLNTINETGVSDKVLVNLVSSGTNLLVNVTGGSLELQKTVTAPVLSKTGSSTVILGTSTTSTDGVIGLVDIQQGTLAASAGTDGIHNSIKGAQVRLAGGATFQLKSNISFNFDNDVTVNGSATSSSTIDVNNKSSGAGNTLRLGNLNLNGPSVILTSGNNYGLNVNGTTTFAGSQTFDVRISNTGSAVATFNTINGGTGTLTKIGTGTMNLAAANNYYGGTAVGAANNANGGILNANVAGSLGSGVASVYNATLGINAPGASTNASGSDVILYAGGQLNVGAAPGPDDVFEAKASGIVRGTGAQLSGLTVGTNLLLADDAIVAHTEDNSADPANIGTTPRLFYGVANAPAAEITVGQGTPWKGVSNDRTSRTLSSASDATPLSVNVAGADNDPTTIDATFHAVAGTTLTLGNGAGPGAFRLNSLNGNKVTLAFTSTGNGTSAGVANGGTLVLNKSGIDLGAVDKLLVQAGTVQASLANGMGPDAADAANNPAYVVQSGGALNLPTNASATAINANVTIKSGGVLYLQNTAGLYGIGSITQEGGAITRIANANALGVGSGGPGQLSTVPGSIVRLEANDVLYLDDSVHDAATVVVTGGNRNQNPAAGGANLTLNGGVLTHDNSDRSYSSTNSAGAAVGVINVGSNGATFAASAGKTFTINPAVNAAGYAVTINSPTQIDGLDKNGNVVFRGGFTAGSVTLVNGITGSSSYGVVFDNANTNVSGDITVNAGALFLGGGGKSDGKGALTPRLTDTSGLVADRVADRIVLGDQTRVEMGLLAGSDPTARIDVTQPFVISGGVALLDKRNFYVSRKSAPTNSLGVNLRNVTLYPGATLGVNTDGNCNVRVYPTLQGDLTTINDKSNSNYDFGDITTSPAGKPVTIFHGAGGTNKLQSNIYGNVPANVTFNNINGYEFFQDGATLDGTIDTGTAPAGGDSWVQIRTGQSGGAPLSGAGKIILRKSAAAGGAEDLTAYVNEVATGATAVINTVPIRIDVLNDGTPGADGIIRGIRNGSALGVKGRVVFNNVHLGANATAQINDDATWEKVHANLVLDGNATVQTTSTNSANVFINNVTDNGAGYTLTLGGNTNRIKVTGNVSAKQLVVGGAVGPASVSIEPDPIGGGVPVLNLTKSMNVGSGAVVDLKSALSGATIQVSGGTLNVTAPFAGNLHMVGGSVNLTAPVTIGDGQCLDAEGLNNGTITVSAGGSLTITGGGMISPSQSAPPAAVASVTITGAVAFAGSGAYQARLGDPGVSDMLAVSGDLNLADAANADTLYLTTGASSAGTYTVATYGGVLSGAFDSIVLNGVPQTDGSNVSVDYGAAVPNAITVTLVDPVPEPAALVLVGLGGAGALLARRRRAATAALR